MELIHVDPQLQLINSSHTNYQGHTSPTDSVTSLCFNFLLGDNATMKGNTPITLGNYPVKISQMNTLYQFLWFQGFSPIHHQQAILLVPLYIIHCTVHFTIHYPLHCPLYYPLYNTLSIAMSIVLYIVQYIIHCTVHCTIYCPLYYPLYCPLCYTLYYLLYYPLSIVTIHLFPVIKE